MEILLYLALYSLGIVGAAASAILLAESMERARVSARLMDEAGFLSARIRYAAERATDVSVASSGTRLLLEGMPGRTSFSLGQDTVIEEYQEGPRPLLDSTAMVTELLFEVTANGPALPSLVSMSFTLRAPTDTGLMVQLPFRDSFYLMP